MKKYRNEYDFRTDRMLAGLLQKRKAPLSSDAVSQVLQDLTWHLSGPVQVLLAAYPKKDRAADDVIAASDIDRVDIMYASDNERYLPVFSDPAMLRRFRPECREGEFIYIADKQDLLDFLHANEKVAACVMNPDDDDLLLYRMHLQNMIQVGKER